jgi:hypothetical protein
MPPVQDATQDTLLPHSCLYRDYMPPPPLLLPLLWALCGPGGGVAPGSCQLGTQQGRLGLQAGRTRCYSRLVCVSGEKRRYGGTVR